MNAVVTKFQRLQHLLSKQHHYNCNLSLFSFRELRRNIWFLPRNESGHCSGVPGFFLQENFELISTKTKRKSHYIGELSILSAGWRSYCTAPAQSRKKCPREDFWLQNNLVHVFTIIIVPNPANLEVWFVPVLSKVYANEKRKNTRTV